MPRPDLLYSSEVFFNHSFYVHREYMIYRKYQIIVGSFFQSRCMNINVTFCSIFIQMYPQSTYTKKKVHSSCAEKIFTLTPLNGFDTTLSLTVRCASQPFNDCSMVIHNEIFIMLTHIIHLFWLGFVYRTVSQSLALILD